MKRLLLLVVCAGCSEIVGKGDSYTATFSNVLYRETLVGARHADGSGGVTCTTTYSMSGSVHLQLTGSSGSVEGEGTIDFNETPVSTSPSECGTGPQRRFDLGGPVSGSESNFTFSGGYTSIGAGAADTTKGQFVGSIANNSGSGTITLQYSGTGRGVAAGSVTTGSAQFSVTLSR